MSPADRLRAQAAELLALADELDESTPAPPHFLETGRAMAISRKSSSWLYQNGERFGFGWRLPSGGWAFSEVRLRAFLAERCEKNEHSAKLANGARFLARRFDGKVSA